ncbi:MAG: DNA-binding protein [Candidatus Omnitrophota bacterium]
MQNEKCKIKAQSFKFLALNFIFTLCVLRFAFAQEPIKSADLIVNAKEYDGKNVIFEGEAIGTLMNRGDFCWLNVTESDNAIGIWLPKKLAVGIKFIGGYKERGDWLKIEGIFNRACAEHGGDLDIHAKKITILTPGEKLVDPLPEKKKKLALYLGGVVVCLSIFQLYRLTRKKQLKTA